MTLCLSGKNRHAVCTPQEGRCRQRRGRVPSALHDIPSLAKSMTVIKPPSCRLAATANLRCRLGGCRCRCCCGPTEGSCRDTPAGSFPPHRSTPRPVSRGPHPTHRRGCSPASQDRCSPHLHSRAKRGRRATLINASAGKRFGAVFRSSA